MDTITTQSLIVAFLLTIVAGMGTAVGALMTLLPLAREKKFLAGALGFSAGVMLYVSFLDLIPQAIEELGHLYPPRLANLYTTLAFFGGIALIALIDFLVPEEENPHEYNHTIHPQTQPRSTRTGLLLALAIGIHNFPEGMATFISALDGITVAVPIVIAITLHNIPEGIAVSIPVYNATGSHRKAIVWSIISGLAEPLGALLGMLFLIPIWSPMLNAILLASVAGVMVYISLDELLPGAESYGHHHITVWSLITGMALMAISILMA